MSKVLNLINLEKSDVKYTCVAFPDGEPHIKLDDFDRKQTYQVITRIANPNDLYLLMQVGDILNRAEVEFSLVITYLMSMRMDRVVNYNESFTLKLVASAINAMHPTNVKLIEVHSDRALKEIKNSEMMHVYSPEELTLLYGSTPCYPDAGAMNRYADTYVGKEFCICLKKVRDVNSSNSKIVSLEIMHKPLGLTHNTITIMDDLCDAGGTFVWSSKILREAYPGAQLNIIVTHLVNEVGLHNLCENFDNVYVSNSYKDWSSFKSQYKNLHVVDVTNNL